MLVRHIYINVRVTALAISQQERFVVVGDGWMLRVWDIKNEREFSVIRHPDIVLSLSFAHSGNLIASGSKKGKIRLWILGVSGLCLFSELSHPDLDGDIFSLQTDSNDTVLCARYSTSHIAIWNIQDGKSREIHCLRRLRRVYLDTSFIHALSLWGSENEDVQVWDTRSGRIASTIHMSGNVAGATFSRCGKYIITGIWNGDIEIRDVGTGEVLYRNEQEENGVATSFRLGYSNEHFVSLHQRTTGQIYCIRVWRLNIQDRIK